VQDFLSPWEQQLADQINEMNIPVHVEVAPAPLLQLQLGESMLLPEGGGQLSAQAADLLAPGRSSWRQFVEKLDEPGDSKGLQELLDWFGSAGAAGPATAVGGGGGVTVLRDGSSKGALPCCSCCPRLLLLPLDAVAVALSCVWLLSRLLLPPLPAHHVPAGWLLTRLASLPAVCPCRPCPACCCRDARLWRPPADSLPQQEQRER
jgi:hypothetical protein